MSPVPDRQVPGVHHRKVGDIIVTSLLDGYIDVPSESLRNAPAAEVESILDEAFCGPRPRITVNAYLVRSGDQVVLIETGSGATLGPTLGWLGSALSSAGVRPDEIAMVLLTHMHPDHSNGLTDEAGGLVFPNAELLIHEDEVAHWTNADRAARAEGRQVVYFQTAQARIDAYRDRLRTFRSGPVFPGITSEPIPGHTPGHTSYRIASGNASLLVWGDIVHVPEVQIGHPEIATMMDTDPDAAVATRRRVLDMVASDRQLVAGMHVGFPGLAHIARRGSSYVLVPETWSMQM